MSSCTLCGLPTGDRSVRDGAIDGEFCCKGCLEVYRISGDIDETQADSPTGEPADSSAIDRDGETDAIDGEGETDGIDDSVETDAIDGDLETAFLSIEGMHCTTCETFLEATATETAGIRDTQASYATEMVRVTYDPATIDRDDLSDAISGLGYRAGDPDERGQERGRSGAGNYRAVVAAFLAMPVMALYLLFIYPTYVGIYPEEFLYGSTIQTMVYVPLVAWSTLIVLGLGYPIFRSGYVSLAIGRPNVDVLIAIAVLAAYTYSFAAFAMGSRHLYFDVAVMVLVVVTVGNHVESRVKQRAVGTHADLAASHGASVRLLSADGSIEEVTREACDPGDRVLVTSGDQVPFDGTVVEGTATIDEALVTGESIPRSASVDDEVVGGSVVADGSLVVEVGAEGSSTLDRLVERLWDAQSSDAGSQRLVNAFAVLFVPLVLVVAGAGAGLWLAAGRPVSAALLIGLSVLVVSCPCSLGIATPLALAAGSSRAAENRTVVLTTNVLERITDSDIVVFDKTGTLTTGEMTVETVVADDPDAVLERAAAVESRSGHPIAEAIVDAAAGPREQTVTAFEREPRTVSATVDGCRVSVGHPAAFRSEAWEIPERIATGIASARERGFQPTVVGWDGVVHGVIAVRDRPRESWEDVVDALAADGRRIVVLTGDDERATQWLQAQSNVDDVFAGVRPESKEAIVRRLRTDGTTTMIGDGTNDAPALARADMGIALEGGTDIAIDAADIVVLDDDLESIPTVFEISRATRRRIRQNLGWALCYNVVVIPLALIGSINPLIAALLMGISSFIVVINSGRGSIRMHE